MVRSPYVLYLPVKKLAYYLNGGSAASDSLGEPPLSFSLAISSATLPDPLSRQPPASSAPLIPPFRKFSRGARGSASLRPLKRELRIIKTSISASRAHQPFLRPARLLTKRPHRGDELSYTRSAEYLSIAARCFN